MALPLVVGCIESEEPQPIHDSSAYIVGEFTRYDDDGSPAETIVFSDAGTFWSTTAATEGTVRIDYVGTYQADERQLSIVANASFPDVDREPSSPRTTATWSYYADEGVFARGAYFATDQDSDGTYFTATSDDGSALNESTSTILLADPESWICDYGGGSCAKVWLGPTKERRVEGNWTYDVVLRSSCTGYGVGYGSAEFSVACVNGGPTLKWRWIADDVLVDGNRAQTETWEHFILGAGELSHTFERQ
jgi:hypothetical protein